MATNEEDSSTVSALDDGQERKDSSTVSALDDGQERKDEEDSLRRFLRVHRYAPIKLMDGKFHIHFWYFLVMILQLAKIVLITIQIITFAGDRASYSSVVNRGRLTLHHLLLKSWDSSREIPPYPPAQGDFAMYDVNDLLEELNYAVEAYYNIENDAIGFYKLYDNSTDNDGMTIRMKYFDFSGFDGVKLDSGLAIKDSEIKVSDNIGLSSTVDPETNKTTYKFNITEAFEVMNLTEPIKRLLSLDLVFSLHSVRVYKEFSRALCLHIDGTVSFRDEDNNGQVIVNLETSSKRKWCSDINISVPDVDFDTGYEGMGRAVIGLCILSCISSLSSFVFGISIFIMMKKSCNGKDNETKLPLTECVKYFIFLMWDIILCTSDGLSIHGTINLALTAWTSDDLLFQFDNTAIELSIGGLLTFVYILKIFKFHRNSYILFTILYEASSKVLAYLICISVLFLGYFLFGFVVLGPYHIKFATASDTMETLFSISNGDEIYATLANVEHTKSGSDILWFFSRLYIYSYVALYAVIILNILIAIFSGAQDAIEKNREKRNKNLETALNNFLTTKDNKQRSILKSKLFSFLENGDNTSPEIIEVKAEFEKVWTKTGEGDSKNGSKPVTLKAFMMGEDVKRSEGYSRDCFILRRFVFHILGSHFLK